MTTADSLLAQLAKPPNDAAWQRLVELYLPLLRVWLARAGVPAFDADDLTQEVLLVVLRDVKDFVPQRDGSFRAWLRGILHNRVRDHFKKRPPHRPPPVGGSDFLDLLNKLQSPDSSRSALWDREDERHLFGVMLLQIEPDFEPGTWRAFRRHVLEDAPAAQVAAELGVTNNAVLLAKSRILKRLRREADGLLD